MIYDILYSLMVNFFRLLIVDSVFSVIVFFQRLYIHLIQDAPGTRGGAHSENCLSSPKLRHQFPSSG